VREHDTLVVCRLDRLGGDIVYLVELGRNLDDRGVKFWSISEGLDSRTPIGKAQFGMFAVFAELRLALIQEAVNDGLELARAQGRTGGRPRAVTDEQLAAARILIEQGTGVAEVARSMKIGRATLYRALGR
jgi:DNA invertase Pin-like site-specific DNA recombinase